MLKVGWRAVHFLNTLAGVAALLELPIRSNVTMEAARGGEGRGASNSLAVVL